MNIKNHIRLLSSLIVFLLLIYLVNHYKNNIIDKTIEYISRSNNLEIHYDNLNSRIFPFTLEVDSPRIKNNGISFTAKKVKISLRFFPLLVKKIYIRKILIDNPEFDIVLAKRKKGKSKSDIPTSYPKIIIEDGIINSLRAGVVYDDKGITLSIPKIALKGNLESKITLLAKDGLIKSKEATIPINRLSLAFALKEPELFIIDNFTLDLATASVRASGELNNKNFSIDTRGTIELATISAILAFQNPINGKLNFYSKIKGSHKGIENVTANAELDGFEYEDFSVNNIKSRFTYEKKKVNSQIEYEAKDLGKVTVIGDIETTKPFKYKGEYRINSCSLHDILKSSSVKTKILDANVNGNGKINGTIYPFLLSGNTFLEAKDFNIFDEDKAFLSIDRVRVNSPIVITTDGLKLNKANVLVKDSPIVADTFIGFVDSMDIFFTSRSEIPLSLTFFDRKIRTSTMSEGRIWGKYTNLKVDVTGTFSNLNVNDLYVKSIAGNLIYENEFFKTKKIIIEKENSRIDLSGELNLDGYTDLKATLINLEPKFLNIINEDISKINSKISGNIISKGKWKEQDIEVNLNLQKGSYNNFILPETRISGKINKYDSVAFTFKTEKGGVDVKGSIKEKSLYITSSDFEIDQLLDNRINLSGTLITDIHLVFADQKPYVDGVVGLLNTKWNRINFGEINLNLSYASEQLIFSGLIFNKRAKVEGSILTFNEFNVILKLDHLSSSILQELKIKDTISGQLSLNGFFRDLSKFNGRLSITELAIEREDIFAKNDSEIIIDIRDSLCTLTRFNLLTTFGQLTLSGSTNIQNGLLDVRGEYNLDLDHILSRYKKYISAYGNSHLTANLTGSIKEPIIIGKLIIEPSIISFKDFPLDINIDRSELKYTNKAIEVSSFRGRAGGGNFNLGGEIILDKFKPKSLNLIFDLSSLLISIPQVGEGLANLNLSAGGAIPGFMVRGTLNLLDLKIIKKIGFFATKKDSIKIKSGAINLFNYEINVVSDNTIIIDNNLISAIAGGSVLVTGSNLKQDISGRVRILEGKVKFRESEFQIKRGSFQFKEQEGFYPTFDLAAETEISDYEIMLEVSGDNKNFDLHLSSTPFLSEADILSLLEVGILNTEGRDESLSLSTWEAASIVSAEAQSYIEKELNKRLKFIKTFQMVPVYSDVSNSIKPIVMVGSEITQDVGLTYKTTLTDITEQEAELQYKIEKNILLMGNWKNRGANRNNEIGLDVVFRFEFE